METIDALGSRPERRAAFTPDLLAEAEDEELNTIVQQASRELGTPIALVNLVLDHIQFFKAHYGLPADLAAARGTDRDVSFCQFVVRDGQPFEVNDAELDLRVPQHLVRHYGIRSYLGIPIIADDTIVGSLCVIDTKPRSFSVEQRQNLQQLAGLVNIRLAALSSRRQQSRSSLRVSAAMPALTEMQLAIKPIQQNLAEARMAVSAIGPLLHLIRFQLSGGHSRADTVRQTLSAAQSGLDSCLNILYNVEASAGDVVESMDALQQVFTQSSIATLSEIAVAGRELARHNCRSVGGIYLSEPDNEAYVSTPRTLGVALVSLALSLIATHAHEAGVRDGLQVDLMTIDSRAVIVIDASALAATKLFETALVLNEHTREEPTVVVQAVDGTLLLLFARLQLSKRTTD